MFRKADKDSPAIRMLRALWDGRQESTSHSWLRLNQSMRHGLLLAVEMGLRFAEDDFNVMQLDFRLGYWAGDLEEFYRRAIAYGNRSAWKAYERHANRKPFLFANRFRMHYGGGGSDFHPSLRVVIGSEFEWKRERVFVTSIDDAKGQIVACSYTVARSRKCRSCGGYKQYRSQTIKHRYTITREELRVEQKRRNNGKVREQSHPCR